MGVQIFGKDGAAVADVDTGHDAQRVSLRPSAVAGWVSLGLRTGILPAATPAGALLFVMRNTGANLLLVRRFSLAFLAVTAFTAAQRLEFSLTRARSWTAAFEATGAAVNFAMGFHRTTLAPLAAEGRVATTAGITASTRTVDAQALGIVGGGVGALGTSIPSQPLVSHDAGDYPVVLAAGEGLLLTSDVLFGAGGSGVALLNIEVAEMPAAKWS